MLSPEPRVQLSRGHWQRQEREGAIRSAGWWESVTVTWSSAATPEDRPPPLLRRALAAAFHTIAPSIVELAAAGTRRLLARQHGTRTAFPSARRQLRTVARELPRSEQSP